jgi:predicted AlkP superfamily pyrophosphatase or phosphodiesterase
LYNCVRSYTLFRRFSWADLESTLHTIQTKNPNLLLVHFTDLDTQRHDYGFSSKEAIAAIHRHNERLGRIIKALKESGIYENSTVVA